MFLLLAMPSGEYVFANDLVDVLKKKHSSGTYDRMVNSLALVSQAFFSLAQIFIGEI